MVCDGVVKQLCPTSMKKYIIVWLASPKGKSDTIFKEIFMTNQVF